MDTSVKRIRPTNLELSQVQDNLAECIQQLLDFANGNADLQAVLEPALEQLRGPGTPYSLRSPALVVHGDKSNSGKDVVTIGDPATESAPAVPAQVGVIGKVSVEGPVTLKGNVDATGNYAFNGDVSGNGNFFFKSRTGDGFVISPNVAGASFFVTNVGNTVPVFIVYDTGQTIIAGPTSAPTFISNNGFKAIVPMGHYYHTSYPGGQRNTVEAIVNQVTNGANYKTARFVAPRKGSVTAIMVDLEFAVNARTDAGVLVNGNLIVYPSIMAANVAKGAVNYPKGVVPFNAGDVLTCYLGWNAAPINACAKVNLEVELGA